MKSAQRSFEKIVTRWITSLAWNSYCNPANSLVGCHHFHMKWWAVFKICQNFNLKWTCWDFAGGHWKAEALESGRCAWTLLEGLGRPVSRKRGRGMGKQRSPRRHCEEEMAEFRGRFHIGNERKGKHKGDLTLSAWRSAGVVPMAIDTWCSGLRSLLRDFQVLVLVQM